MTSILGVIPARISSSRLPAKPLKDIAGKSLLQRVYEQATKASLSRLIIATDSTEIETHAKGFGAEVMLTSSANLTGTDRVAEVARRLRESGSSFDIVVNIQGDMPFINPEVINSCVNALTSGPSEFGMSTICTPIFDDTEFSRPASVKVVLGHNQSALYFSRAPVPFWRDRGKEALGMEVLGYRHIGLYCFRLQTLLKIAALKPCELEEREKLEQLRALAYGFRIRAAIIDAAALKNQIEVDTPEDLERAIRIAFDN